MHLGQFGIHSGKCVWQLYCKEHGIEIDGTISESGPIENIYRFNCFTECNEGGNDDFMYLWHPLFFYIFGEIESKSKSIVFFVSGLEITLFCFMTSIW